MMIGKCGVFFKNWLKKVAHNYLRMISSKSVCQLSVVSVEVES